MVSGQAEYLDDILPSADPPRRDRAQPPRPRTRIVSIDVENARQAPGVRAVLTPQEAAELTGPIPHYFNPVGTGGNTAEFFFLTGDVVRFVGEPIVAVAASSVAEAEAAV